MSTRSSLARSRGQLMVANLSSGRREFIKRITRRPVQEYVRGLYRSTRETLTKAKR